MYGGPRRPNFSPFQGRARIPHSDFRPRFENPAFLPPGQIVYPSQRQPFPSSSQRPQFMNNPGPPRPRVGFQPRPFQAGGPRQSYPPKGYSGQPRWPHRGRGRGFKQKDQDSPGIEAYYRHSMVENPWRELEQKYKDRTQQD